MNNPKLKKFAPIIIGIGIAGVLLVLGFKFMQGGFARANDIAPVGGSVQIASITSDSAQISWNTAVATQCVIQYNSSLTGVDSGSFFPEITKTTTHNLTLTLLAESTDYYFNIKCEDKTFDNAGAPYTFKTLSKNDTGAKPTTTVTVPPEAINTITPPAPSVSLAPTDGAAGCAYTDCATILQHIGNGCTYKDYLPKCNNITPTPTLIQAPTITPTP
jgi:hypothetical protein